MDVRLSPSHGYQEAIIKQEKDIPDQKLIVINQKEQTMLGMSIMKQEDKRPNLRVTMSIKKQKMTEMEAVAPEQDVETLGKFCKTAVDLVGSVSPMCFFNDPKSIVGRKLCMKFDMCNFLT